MSRDRRHVAAAEQHLVFQSWNQGAAVVRLRDERAPSRRCGGRCVVRPRDERGAMLALRLRPGQVRTLANGQGGIVAAVY